ncbi:hypothetical protein Agsp01_36100 [Agromyces sp. NBRC 114283]|nr:hypothetical protein Agsp01_36100 [Agromyces sp. NBRC 114283]
MRFFLADAKTGRNLIPITATGGRWEVRRNRAGDTVCTIPLSNKEHRRLNLYETATPGATILGIGEGSWIAEAGPIWEHDFDEDRQELVLTAEGMWSMLMRRYVLPPAVETTSLLLTSGDDSGKPNPAVATSFTGKSWPFIVRTLLQQGMSRTGGALPLVFGPDGTGAHDKTYDAASFKTQGEALLDLTELENGPEIDLRPRYTADGLGIEVLVRVGDDAKLQLSSVGDPHVFDFSVPKRTVRGLKVKRSAKMLASEAWASGGRQAAIALIARAASSVLLEAGFPRMESLSSAHSTVTEQATLDAYAAGELSASQKAHEWWSFETNIDKVPKLGSFWLGDYCNVIMRNSSYVPDGTYRRRIAAISGSLSSRWVRITTDEAVDA